MRRKQSETSFGVIGLGRFGTALVKTLAEAGQEVIAVDKDEQKVKAVRKYTDYAFVVGMLNEESLQETGVQNCDTVTICIGEQLDVSILTTMQVIKMGIPHVISKANSQEHGEVLKQLGATVVYPEADMAVRIGKRLISDNLIDYISLDDDVEVRRIQVGGRAAGPHHPGAGCAAHLWNQYYRHRAGPPDNGRIFTSVPLCPGGYCSGNRKNGQN